MTKQEIEELIQKELHTLRLMARYKEFTGESDEEYYRKVDYYLDRINKLKKELEEKK